MANGSLQQHKALVWEFWETLNASQADKVAEVVQAYVHPNIIWYGPHPINDLHGASALIAAFWQPLRAALPDLKRTTKILIGGHGHWVAEVGYFRGTFVNDWLGIPATGRELTIRFGEFSAVHAGKIVLSYMLPDILDVIRQAGLQLVAPSLGKEGLVQGPLTGDGVFFTPQNEAEGAKTLALAKTMCAALNTPSLGSFWDTERMLWYGPSGIGTTRGFDAFIDQHQDPFNHAFPSYGSNHMGIHAAEVGEGNYAAWVGWPSIRATQVGEYLGCPPSGRQVEWRLMDFYRREGELIIENWVPIDMIHVFLTMGFDVMEQLHKARLARGDTA
jgi:predicted ester cyclase